MKEYLDKKILLVDDVAMSVMFLSKELTKIGFTNLHEFTDSIEAWESFAGAQLSDNPYDLVITDLNMPGLDGMEFVAQIKNDEMSKNTKIIIVSADHDPLVIDEAMEIGVEEYITKPIIASELEDKMKFVFKGFPFETTN